ncbi:MAG TPA: TIGR01777 family oxidoreductase [Acidobacteriota bacterium]|nr:TIGR01777 family oxidoreductase [Acidobacteriota bacterium]
MNILVSGSTGFIGSRLTARLRGSGHRVIRLVRKNPSGSDEIGWTPSSGVVDFPSHEKIDAVVHLAGENIASGRWTDERKRLIMNSRIQGTSVLAESLARHSEPPGVFLSVSAVGYYGNRGDEWLDEESGPGRGFLPDLCRRWEAATEPAAARGIRVVIPRLGMVLSAAGGALPIMLPVFRRGIGGRLGSGRQFMSWIVIDDLLGVIEHALSHDSVQGPVNAVSPQPVRNAEFSRALGRALSRPSFFVLPAFAARLALGQMADEVLLASARVSSARLLKSGYEFAFPEIEGALRHALAPA